MTIASLVASAQTPGGCLGVLPYRTGTPVDPILRDAVARLQARGLRIGGLFQRSGATLPSGRPSFWLDDIASGQTIRLDQPRGVDARSCILDPAALPDASLLLRRTLESHPDIIAINRFGHAEAEGGGLRPEIADALCAGAVVLLAAREGYLPALETFLGAPPILLPPDAERIAGWAAAVASAAELSA